MTKEDSTEARGRYSDVLAHAWERHRERLFEFHREVSEWLIDQIDPEPGHTVLELGAGPGETGFLAADRVGPEGRLISTDLGPGMVGAARRGAQARGLTNLECRVMDAQQIDLPAASVDGVICRFGLMFMPQPDRALAGARRVLRLPGRLAYAVWGPPERNPWMTLLGGAVRQHGHQPPGNPAGPGGSFSLASAQRNRDLLARAGFSDIQIEEIANQMRFADFDDYWSVLSEVSGSLAPVIASLSNDEVCSIQATVRPMLEPFASNAGYELPTLAIVASAR